jgi:hypothetical protein
MALAALSNLSGAFGMEGTCDEAVHEAEKAGHVRERCVGVEGGVIGPLRVNDKGAGIARCLIEMNANAARLGAGRLWNELQLVEKQQFFSGLRFKANKGVNRHNGPSEENCISEWYICCR